MVRWWLISPPPTRHLKTRISASYPQLLVTTAEALETCSRTLGRSNTCLTRPEERAVKFRRYPGSWLVKGIGSPSYPVSGYGDAHIWATVNGERNQSPSRRYFIYHDWAINYISIFLLSIDSRRQRRPSGVWLSHHRSRLASQHGTAGSPRKLQNYYQDGFDQCC